MVDAIRKTFYEGGCDEIVTTRRLIDTVTAFAVFGERLKGRGTGVCAFR